MSSVVEAERPSSGWKEAFAPGVEAARHHWAPFLFIQACAAALVVWFYHSAWLREATVTIQQAKSHGGPAFAAALGAGACGFIPMVALLVTRKQKVVTRAFLADMAFNAFVYAIIALEIDYFYKLQAFMFGGGGDVATVLKKNAMDMLAFTPILSIPSATALFQWRIGGFSGRRLLAGLRSGFYRTKVIPALIPCWAFWIPMLCCVYSLPYNLQFPFAQLAEASWCLLFVHVATREVR